jgi:hypothetical protein
MLRSQSFDEGCAILMPAIPGPRGTFQYGQGIVAGFTQVRLIDGFANQLRPTEPSPRRLPI